MSRNPSPSRLRTTNLTNTSSTNNNQNISPSLSPSSASINSTRGISGIGHGFTSTNGLSGLSGLSASSTYVSPAKMAMTTPIGSGGREGTNIVNGMSSTTTGRTTISK